MPMRGRKLLPSSALIRYGRSSIRLPSSEKSSACRRSSGVKLCESRSTVDCSSSMRTSFSFIRSRSSCSSFVSCMPSSSARSASRSDSSALSRSRAAVSSVVSGGSGCSASSRRSASTSSAPSSSVSAPSTDTTAIIAPRLTVRLPSLPPRAACASLRELSSGLAPLREISARSAAPPSFLYCRLVSVSFIASP